jgi:hypothetical protein
VLPCARRERDDEEAEMLRLLIAVLTVAGVAFVLPLSARADDKPKSEKAGGAAAEHRSEQAAESGNPQWSEGATKGQERAEERRGQKTEKTQQKAPDVASPPPAKEKKARKAKKPKAE